ncbi:MAG: DUF5053 domain-containing protein [Mediterranea sp.]|jgi:hypothetical protein|nr:DUF5053 domain-containing protein [Mediterranea sp.]
MDKTTRFLELKELWKKSDEARRAEIDKEIAALLDSMGEKDIDSLTEGVKLDFARIHADMEGIQEELVRKKLEGVLPAISVSYLAKRYFGKSSSWFYQRMNGNKVNGKPAAFTPAELRTLADALADVGRKLSAASMDL